MKSLDIINADGMTVMTGSPGDRIGPEAGRLGLSHWAGPSVTGSAKVSQSFYRGIIIVILTKGKPVPLVWEFIYKLGEVTRVTSTYPIWAENVSQKRDGCDR